MLVEAAARRQRPKAVVQDDERLGRVSTIARARV
jgi:hypothetical protein